MLPEIFITTNCKCHQLKISQLQLRKSSIPVNYEESVRFKINIYKYNDILSFSSLLKLLW